MATSTRCENDFNENPNVKSWTSDAFDTALANFLLWCQKEGLKINSKVQIGKDSSCSEYGMRAVTNIEEGECLCIIPRTMILHPGNCAVTNIFKANPLPSKSGWAELLTALLFEQAPVKESKWKPYLDLFPNKKLDLPMFWPQSEIDDLLKGTGIPEAVELDLMNISKEFSSLVEPYIHKHKQELGCSDGKYCKSYYQLDFYKKMVAFVMAYSFTESQKEEGDDEEEVECQPSAPMMVPVADILNHKSNNNSKLIFEKENLSIVATRAIYEDEEICSSYGQLANWQLLQRYGFAEKPSQNQYDTVDIPANFIKEAAQCICQDRESSEFFKEKCDFLQEMDLFSADGSFILGTEGILTDEEMKVSVKVLLMNPTEFSTFKENEEWSSDDEEEESARSLDLSTYGNIKSLPFEWKQILKRTAELCFSKYDSSLEEDEKFLKYLETNKVNARKLYAFYTKYGQKLLLKKLLDCCN